MLNVKSLLCAVSTVFFSFLVEAAPHDPNIQIRVVPYPDGDPATLSSTVTLSSSRYDAHVSYRVQLFNATTNTLNRSFFSATTAVDASTNDATIDAAVYAESGAVTGCTLGSNATLIRCDIGNSGSLAPGQGATFWVVVRAPTAGTKLTFSTTFGGDEGNGGGNGCCDQISAVTTNLIDPVLNSADPNAPFKNEVRSFVKSSGGKFYTGLEVATSTDPWVTIVTIPPVTNGLSGLPFTTASIDESRNSAQNPSCSAINANNCFASALTIPGTFANLTVILRQDASAIKPGSKIENWVIYYSHDPQTTAFAPLQFCSTTGGPAPGAPCIDFCQVYTKKAFPTLPDYWGDFECTIKAKDNGLYRN